MQIARQSDFGVARAASYCIRIIKWRANGQSNGRRIARIDYGRDAGGGGRSAGIAEGQVAFAYFEGEPESARASLNSVIYGGPRPRDATVAKFDQPIIIFVKLSAAKAWIFQSQKRSFEQTALMMTSFPEL